ncbi:MAG TPA: ABC transporter ATP-binding protein [Bordetella sp.]
MSLLQVSSVSKRYGGVQALSDINLEIQPDQFFAVIGPNGAGKSTLLNVLTGLVPPSSGSIRFEGRDLTASGTHAIVRAGIGRIFQSGRLFSRLTVLENVMMGSAMAEPPSVWATVLRPGATRRREAVAREAAMGMLESFGLQALADRSIGSLSYGNRRLVEMARVMAARPRLLLLDEPAAGLNSGEVENLMEMLRRLRGAHRLSVVLIEHNMGMVMRLAERIAVLNFGSKLAEGTPQEIQGNPDVLEAYLGKGYQNVEM